MRPDENGGPVREEHELVRLATLLRGTNRAFDATVRGTSMETTIPANVSVRIVCQSHEHIPIGAVVSFVAGRTLVAHRLVHRGLRGPARRYVVTHGDGEWLCDPPCEVERIVGVAQQWRRSPDDRWCDVGEESPRHGFLGAVSRFTRWAICSALEMNVWLARAIFSAAYWPLRVFGAPRARGL